MKSAARSPWTKNFILYGGICIIAAIALTAYFAFTTPSVYEWFARQLNKKTVADRLAQYREKVETVYRPLFAEKKIEFPPKHVALFYIKDQKKLFLYAGPNENETQLIKTYDVLAASGKPGPKLKEGDHQVPEGVYTVEALNPNSMYHLALRVSYPNAFDLERAETDGRENIGSDIMIHGSNVSIGCVAIGDAAIEELFVLAALTEYQNWRLVFAPTDFRHRTRDEDPTLPAWLVDLDQKILREFLVIPE